MSLLENLKMRHCDSIEALIKENQKWNIAIV